METSGALRILRAVLAFCLSLFFFQFSCCFRVGGGYVLNRQLCCGDVPAFGDFFGQSLADFAGSFNFIAFRRGCGPAFRFLQHFGRVLCLSL